MSLHIRLLILFLLASIWLRAQAAPATAPAHGQFRVAVYIPVEVVKRMQDPAWLQQSWDAINSQVKVDKVYIESYRSGILADGKLLESVKSFFTVHGVEVAGGIAFTAKNSGQFVTFSYTEPKDRAYVKHISEVTARHFNEIILDDFFSPTPSTTPTLPRRAT